MPSPGWPQFSYPEIQGITGFAFFVNICPRCVRMFKFQLYAVCMNFETVLGKERVFSVPTF